MTLFLALRRRVESLLEGIMVFLMLWMFLLVVVGVGFRKFGDALAWYDEVGEVSLVWLTYYGASLAALKRAHIGFPGLMQRFPVAIRLPLGVFSEAVIFGFFITLAWLGYQVLPALEGDHLVSLTWVPVEFTQSVIPIGATLFVIAQILTLPEHWRWLKGQGPLPGSE